MTVSYVGRAWLVGAAVACVCAVESTAWADATTGCAATCEAAGLSPEARTRASTATEPVLQKIRSCLTTIGGDSIRPVVIANVDNTGRAQVIRIDAGGYEKLSCMPALAAANSNESVARCELRCDGSAPPPPPPAAAVVPGAIPNGDVPPPPTEPPRQAPAARRDADKDKTEDADEDSHLERVTLTANPLSLLQSRIGINVEVMVARHHGLILNPYFQSVSVGNDAVGATYTNFGAELGYRFYTGSRGANGFFIGPFVLGQHANIESRFTSSTSNPPPRETSIFVYGFGLDLGAQHIFRNGFTIGAGGGIHYLVSESSNVSQSSTVKVEGLLPRILFTLGYSF